MSEPILTEGVAEQPMLPPVKGNPFSRGIVNYFRHLRRFNHNIRCLLAGSFLMSLAAAFFNLLQNLYFQKAGFGESFMGSVLSFISLGMVFFAIPISLLVDRISFKKLLIIANLSLSGAGMLFLASFSKYLLFPAAFAIGGVITVQAVIAAPFIMRNTSEKERIFVFSMLGGMQVLSNFVGSAVAGVMGEYFAGVMGDAVLGYRTTLVIGLTLALFALIPFSLIKENLIRKEQPRSLKKFFKTDSWPTMIRLAIPTMMIGMGAGLVIPFMNVYFASTFNVGADDVGFYISLNFAFMFLGIALGPVLAKRFGIVRVMVATQLLSIPFFLVLAFTGNLVLAVIAFLARAALMNMSWPMGQNFNMEVVKPKDQALTNSIMMLSWNLAWMLSVRFGGALIEWAGGYSESMCIAAGIYLLSALLYFSFFRKPRYIEIGKETD